MLENLKPKCLSKQVTVCSAFLLFHPIVVFIVNHSLPTHKNFSHVGTRCEVAHRLAHCDRVGEEGDSNQPLTIHIEVFSDILIPPLANARMVP